MATVDQYHAATMGDLLLKVNKQAAEIDELREALAAAQAAAEAPSVPVRPELPE